MATNHVETPGIPSGNEKQQLEQMFRYLSRLADDLNVNLDAIGGNELTDDERIIMQQILAKAAEDAGIPEEDAVARAGQEMESLKSLIIKTASFVQTKLDEMRTNLIGETVAEGKFGKYVRRTGLDMVVTPEGITQNYTLQDIVTGLSNYEVNAKNYIKTGLLRTVSSIPVYGVAVGKDVVTFTQDGQEIYNDGNKVCEMTADEISFYNNSSKTVSYTGSAITFYSDNTKLMEVKPAEIAFYQSGNKVGSMTGTAVTFFSSNKKMAELKPEALTFYTNDNSNNKLLELTGSSIDFYYNGAKVFYISSGTITAAGNLEMASGKAFKIVSGAAGEVQAGGNLNIRADGRIVIKNGGQMFLETGGDLTIGGGANLNLESGADLNIKSNADMHINSNGELHVESGGALHINSDADLNIKDGGNLNIRSGGTVTLFSGGEMIIASAATLDIWSGGNMLIRSGGTLTINSGGTLDVNATNFSIKSADKEVIAGNFHLNDYGFHIDKLQNTPHVSNIPSHFVVGDKDKHNYTGDGYYAGILYQNHLGESNNGGVYTGFILPEIFIFANNEANTKLFNIRIRSGLTDTDIFDDTVGQFKHTNLGTSNYPFDHGYINTLHTTSQYQVSSRERKHSIEPMKPPGDRLDQLKPVTFIYNSDKYERTRQGLIYEDTVEVMPEICSRPEEKEKGIVYTELIPMLLKEIQELRARVKTLEEGR